MELKKEFSFLDVFCIASGAMISSGIFILPGLAFSLAGPSVVFAYTLAGILALTGIMSVAELATAMPKAGGDYYFITRSLGPLVGTISGFLSWAALSLKTAFAVFGIAEVIYQFTGMNVRVCAIVLCVCFMGLNIIGVKEAAKFKILRVGGLLALMTLFCMLGAPYMTLSHLEPFAPQGINTMFKTAGFVFVSFGGLLKVTSVTEEVKNPRRNLPLGLFAAVSVVTLLYSFLVFVTVGVLSAQDLSRSLTPIADAARRFFGVPGYLAMTVAALLAFITTANAGIMAASRYPLALSRDQLLPQAISMLHKRFRTPIIAIVLTGTFIIFALFLPVEILVKAASTVILTFYVLSNLSVIILRESRIESYQPGFKAPFYPWLQILSIFLFSSLIADMGYTTMEISLSLVLIGGCMYFFYGRKKAQQEYALLHLLERITNKQLTSYNLESELLEILHQRDEVSHDQFDKLVSVSPVLDILGAVDVDEFFTLVATQLTEEMPLDRQSILTLLHQREQESSTVITPFVAIPHIIIEGQNVFKIFVARCRHGIRFSEEHQAVKAVFVIIGTKDERNAHLKALAAVAQIVQSKDFEDRWLRAKNENQLRDILLLSERQRGRP